MDDWSLSSYLTNMACIPLCSPGGSIGLVGAALCGPRLGRFEDGKPKPMPGHDVSSVAMGTILVWFGWFGFNCGSLYVQNKLPPQTGVYVDRIAMNMTLSAASGGLAPLLLHNFTNGERQSIPFIRVLAAHFEPCLGIITTLYGSFTPQAPLTCASVATESWPVWLRRPPRVALWHLGLPSSSASLQALPTSAALISW
jgi:hypothetical protein